MDYTAVISSKMVKVEGSLKELNNEILIATNYLVNLKENSAAIVRNLNSITAPSTYLEQFLNVNSFLLKAATFLAEFNCKFEILGITEKAFSKKFPLPVAGTNIIDNKSEELLECEPVEELSSEGSDDFKIDAIEEQQKTVVPNNHEQKGRSRTKSKSKKSLRCKKKKTNSSSGKVTTSEVKNSNNANVSIKKNDNSNSNTTETKQSGHLGFANNSDAEIPADKINAEGIDEQNKSGSETYGQKYCVTNKISNISSFISVANDLSNNTSFTSVNYNATQISIPVAEVVPTKIIEKNSEYSKDFKPAEDSKEDFVKASQPTVENDEVDEIKPAEIVRKLGEEYDVVVEYIKSPSEFYVSIIDEDKNLVAELENKLKEIPENKKVSCNTKNAMTKTMLSNEIGRYCLVYSRCDEIWCRAKVTNWCLNYDDNFVNIFLLDYGESKCVSIYDLQAMPEYLKGYPALTVRCHLHNVFPVDMEKNSNQLSWGKEASEEMRSLTEESNHIRMKVAPNDSYHPDKSLPVTLWLVDQKNKCINELLVSSRLASCYPIFDKTKEKTETIKDQADEVIENFSEANIALSSWNPMKDDYESYKNSYDLDANDPSSIIYGYVGKDYDRICREFAKTGHCYKGQACRREHKKLDHLGFTTDQEEVFQSAINELKVPPPNSKVNIQVTSLASYNKFFCFMENPKPSCEEENFRTLLKFMNTKQNILEMKKLLIPPSAGQLVIACYSLDKVWYRARVLESQPENDQYVVLYVDYGNNEVLHLSDIRAMEPRYLHLPFQAMQCSIFGIERNPEVPKEKVVEYLRERIKDGHLSIEVISRLPGDNINLLVNVFDQKGENIGTDLISKKFAVKKDEIIINSASESIPG